MELTILMPCLNEAATVARCVAKARGFLERAGIAGEVLVADNGSDDGSPALAERAGARVVRVAERGNAAVTLEYEARRERDGEVCATGATKLACVGKDGKLRRLPKEI